MPDFSFELMHGRGDGKIICGVDEVGRGPLAGPVVAAAAIIPHEGLDPALMAQINDSKKLTAKKREALFPVLTSHCLFAIAEASVEEIDTINILQASLLAMTRAVRSLSCTPSHALIDGNKIPKDLPCPATSIVQGDSKSLSIAVASIIAKVTRDRMMVALHETYPAYGWNKNAGYGTSVHMSALRDHGPTIWHRRSFAPVAALCQEKGLSSDFAEQA
ncbi:MAG: ribonuclease HII [Alphaproteobacteria bacterium]|nr:ribonuclease HII [Alphaproteobacteria bacterium]